MTDLAVSTTINQLVYEGPDGGQIALSVMAQTVGFLTSPAEQGPEGIPGPPGTGAAPAASAVSGEAIYAGQPVYTSRADGKLYLARADVYTKSVVVGIAGADADFGFVCQAYRSTIALSDWTNVVGATFLTPGATYFLGLTPGTLTTIAPSTTGQSVTMIGVASSTTILALSIQQPILL